MEFYTCETLRNICQENYIMCSRLTKKEMFDLLVEKNLIQKMICETPLKKNEAGFLTNMSADSLEGYKERYFLGEEKFEP